MTITPPLLSIRNLKVDFQLHDGNHFSALKNISFDIAANKTTALVGESGSGKSVTSMAILRLLPTSNTVFSKDSQILFEDTDLLTLPLSALQTKRGSEIAMIFQEPMSSLNPLFSIGEQIRESLQKHTSLSAAQIYERVIELLTEVNIPDPANRINCFPHELSGGQQQRVMIAMAIACNPKLLIADEPTTALDVTIQQQILKLLQSLQQKYGMSVLFITHDLGVVANIADEIIVMRNGEILEQNTSQKIFEQPQNPYTKALLNCRPKLTRRPSRLAVVDDFLQETPYVEAPQRNRGYTKEDEIILDVQGLSKHFVFRKGLFQRQIFKAVDNVSFSLAKGKTLGIVGESGSGKTTVGLTLMRLHRATAGRALLQNNDILSMDNRAFQNYKRRIQIIFQNPFASLNPRFSVGKILMEPMLLHSIGESHRTRQTMAMELLERVNLPTASFHKYPHEFSGGQRQRIAIARCLTIKPEILICDESVSALDVSVQAQVLNLLQDLQDDYQLSYIFISHDLSVVKHISDQVMVMQNGKAVEQADSDQIYNQPQHPYTQQLLAAIPRGWPAPAT